MKRYAVAYDKRDGKGFSENTPFIVKDFENTKAECLKIAEELLEECFSHVTPFIIEDEKETYDWKYINEHLLIKPE